MKASNKIEITQLSKDIVLILILYFRRFKTTHGIYRAFTLPKEIFFETLKLSYLLVWILKL